MIGRIAVALPNITTRQRPPLCGLVLTRYPRMCPAAGFSRLSASATRTRIAGASLPETVADNSEYRWREILEPECAGLHYAFREGLEKESRHPRTGTRLEAERRHTLPEERRHSTEKIVDYLQNDSTDVSRRAPSRDS